jgi:collagenase-like PrtC family protease
MSGCEFSLPYNGDRVTLEAELAMNGRNGNRVREIYLGVPQQIAGSGRAGSDELTTMEGFLQVVKDVHAAGVSVDMTMNATCGGDDWYDEGRARKTCDFVTRMHEEHGVEAVTLANPFYIERVRQSCPDIEISASVLADVDCLDRAAAFASAGATTVTVDTSVNRDLELLSAIRDRTRLEIKLMVNEGCLNKCPYRKFHMNLISHRSKEGKSEGSAFSFACGDIVRDDPAQLFKSGWVRPEDLHRYAEAGVTGYFKVVGRDMLRSKVMRCCEAYMDESYDGNLLDLLCSCCGFYGVEHSAYVDNKSLDEDDVFDRLSTCGKRCHDCNYCSLLARRLVRYGWVTEENLRDLGQGALADAIKARFGGTYPKCPHLKERRDVAADHPERRALDWRGGSDAQGLA